jgi:hypothetical protein
MMSLYLISFQFGSLCVLKARHMMNKQESNV